MKKTITALALTLGLAFTVAPAQADDAHPSTPPCYGAHGDEIPCPEPVCVDNHGSVTSCDPCWLSVEQSATPLRAALADQRSTIARQQSKIRHQRAIIKRLRHRLSRG